MATYTNNNVSAGAVVRASDHNTQGALIAAVLNGGIDNNNISPTAAIAGSKLADGAITTAKLEDASVTNAKLETGAGEPGGAWDSFTPVLTNADDGAGTTTGRYKKIGRLVKAEVAITGGAGLSFGTGITVELPVAAAASYDTADWMPVGRVVGIDQNVGIFSGSVLIAASTTVATLRWDNGSSAAASAFPFSEVSGDAISMRFEYEAAA